MSNVIKDIEEIIRDKENMTLCGYDVPAHLFELILLKLKEAETSDKPALNIAIVVGQSEQLNCLTCIDMGNLTGSQECNNCGNYDKRRAI